MVESPHDENQTIVPEPSNGESLELEVPAEETLIYDNRVDSFVGESIDGILVSEPSTESVKSEKYTIEETLISDNKVV